MSVRRHIRLLSMLLVGLAGAGLLVVGFGLTPLSGSVLGSMLGLGPKGDFSLSPSSSYTSVPRGSTETISLMISSLNHFSGDVSLTATITTRSSTPAIAISQSSVKIGPDAVGSDSLSISTTTSTTIGYYNITAQGRTSTVSHSTTISVQVTPPPPPPTPDFYLSSNPSYLTTPLGTSVPAALTISSILSYSGNVALTANVYPSGVNSPSVSLNLTALILLAAGANATTLTVDTSNAAAGSYTIQIVGTSGSHTHTLDTSLTVIGSNGREFLYLEFYYLSSPTNATLYVRNGGSPTTTLISYYVRDAGGDQYAQTTWNGPTINPLQLGLGVVMIGSSCNSCSRTGSGFTFTPGNSYTVVVVTSYGNAFTFTMTVSIQESLVYDHAGPLTSTNVTLYLRNNGNVPATVVSYNVTDASGNRYALPSFSGPTIPVGGVVPVNVLVGSSCPSCKLYGNAFTFTTGNSYTFTFLTSRNNPFTFVITW